MSIASPETATTTASKRYRPEDLVRMRARDDGKTFELVNGKLERLAASSLGSLIATELTYLLKQHDQEHQAAWILGSENMYLLRQDPATLRKPDASVLLKATHPTVPETFISVRPDIAIEVISQNDRVANFEMKLLDYREAGIPLVWVIYPDLLFVCVYEGGSEIPRVLHIDDEIDGGPVLPQFKRPVRDLFSAEIIERAHRLKEDRRRTPTQE